MVLPNRKEMEDILERYGILIPDDGVDRHADIMYDSLRSVLLRIIQDIEEKV